MHHRHRRRRLRQGLSHLLGQDLESLHLEGRRNDLRRKVAVGRLDRVDRRGFAGCRKVVAGCHREVVVEDREAVAGCIAVGVGIDSGTGSEERRSPGFEEGESHSLGLLGVRSWAEEDIAGCHKVAVDVDGLGLVRRNSCCLTSCLLLFWRTLRGGW